MGRVFLIILFLFVSSLSTHSVGKELGINHSKNKDLAALGDTSSKTYRRDTSYIKSRKEVLRIIENEIGDENTCLDGLGIWLKLLVLMGWASGPSYLS